MKHAIEKGSAWALVTGASSGIGLQIAHQLAGLGYNLAIVSRDDNALARAQQQIATEHGIEVRRLTLDLVDRDAATKLHDWTSSQRLEIEILVNNAGAFSFLDVTESSPERIEQLIGLHVVTPTLTCRLYGAEMVRRGHGRILNMSSYSIWMPLPGLALYSASKDYLKNFSRAFAKEVREHGVTVTAVCPAGVFLRFPVRIHAADIIRVLFMFHPQIFIYLFPPKIKRLEGRGDFCARTGVK